MESVDEQHISQNSSKYDKAESTALFILSFGHTPSDKVNSLNHMPTTYPRRGKLSINCGLI
jgi:hypothetical protein